MKRCILATILLMLAPAVKAAGPADDFEPQPFFTWGARVGFAATGTYVTDVFFDGHQLDEYTQDTQIGNFAALQFRLNSKRFFFQSGLGIGMNKSTFTMDRNSWNSTADSKNEFSMSYSMISMMIPAQFGLHAINTPPYTLSVFTGPRLRLISDKYYSYSFSNIDPYILDETPSATVISWTLGMSVQIGRTFFDFEYETSLNNLSGSVSDNSGINPAPDIRMERRFGALSFSYGIMF